MSFKVRTTRGRFGPAQGAGRDPERIRNATRSSLPVFSVDTEDQAQAALVHFCVHRYDGSWRWTHWPDEIDPYDYDSGLDARDAVHTELRAWWAARQPTPREEPRP